MAGIYGVFVKNKSIKKGFELFSNSTQNNVVKDELIIYDLTLGRCVLNKLNNDRFFEKRDKTTICLIILHYTRKRRMEYVCMHI